MTSVKDIYDFINGVAPFDTQEEWDNSGFLAGDFDKTVKTAVMALDAAKAVCEFAVSIDADLILTHHPIIFKRFRQLRKGSALYTVVHGDIAQISAHTNFDLSGEGINFNLAEILGLKNAKRIENSFIVMGELESEMSIDDLAQLVNDRLNCQGIRYTDTERLIKTVAVGGGACEEYISLAEANADCFLTGDLKYHQMLEASENDYPVISAGHFETENMPFLMLKDRLERAFPDVSFVTAPVENPIHTI